MKTLSIYRLLSTAFLITLFWAIAGNVQANNTNQPQVVICSGVGNTWKVRGGATNGISGEADIACEGESHFFVVFYVMRQGSQMSLHGTNPPIYKAFSCGLIELRDGRGNIIPLLKKDMFSPELCPDSFDITNQMKLVPKIRNGYTLMLLPAPQSRNPDFLLEPNKNYSVAYFDLNTYFRPPMPGEYKLTIWPKIYKQSETNKDLYERIDVPPVSVVIKWDN